MILATAQQPPLISERIFKDFVPALKPQMVIFDICIPCFNSEGVESYFNLIKNLPVSSSLFQLALQINKPQVYHNFSSAWLRHFHRSLYSDLKIQRPKSYFKGFINEYKNDESLRFNFNYNKGKYQLKKPNEIEKRNLSSLEEMIHFAKKNNLKLILTRQPNLWSQNISLMVKITALANQYRIPIYDLDHEKYRLDPATDFYDKSHLNSQGGAKTSKILIEEKLKPDPDFTFLWEKRN